MPTLVEAWKQQKASLNNEAFLCQIELGSQVQPSQDRNEPRMLPEIVPLVIDVQQYESHVAALDRFLERGKGLVGLTESVVYHSDVVGGQIRIGRTPLELVD